jgi:hypothetical protein
VDVEERAPKEVLFGIVVVILSGTLSTVGGLEIEGTDDADADKAEIEEVGAGDEDEDVDGAMRGADGEDGRVGATAETLL